MVTGNLFLKNKLNILEKIGPLIRKSEELGLGKLKSIDSRLL
jgi:hypothetical protein